MRLLLLFLLTLNLLNAEKIALLIGNNDYSFQPLDNPLNDVDGIYKTLREIGFKESNIKVLKNVSKTKMETALANFSQRASSAEIALVYFSGHGMQVNNTNYMFPANTTATKPIHLRTLVDLDYFIESASSAKYGIILVDACRNNPLIKYFQNGKHKGSTAKKGLGRVEPTYGKIVIGFATSAGDTADDGKGHMSPYATALANRLKEKDDIRNILGKVSDDVSGKYEQNPIYRANLAENVFLNQNKTQSNEIVTINGLMYQNQPFNQFATLEEASNSCQKLQLGGYTNWRLPIINELKKIVTKYKHTNSKGYSYYIRKEFIENMPIFNNGSWDNSFFWSFSNLSFKYRKAQGIDFNNQDMEIPTYATALKKHLFLCVK